MTGAELIAAERQRQIEKELWDADHDDQHDGGELVSAAVAYALDHAGPGSAPPTNWPWSGHLWKPKSRLKNLVRAGALIAAELDRLERVDTCDQTGPSPEEERDSAIKDAVQEYATRRPGESEADYRWRQRFVEGKLIGLTIGLCEHPECMDNLPCFCDECRSNGAD